MYELKEYSENCLKRSGSFLQYYKDEPPLNNADTVDGFPGNSNSFRLKQKITGKTENNGYKKCWYTGGTETFK